jgi:hypothetical protein
LHECNICGDPLFEHQQACPQCGTTNPLLPEKFYRRFLRALVEPDPDRLTPEARKYVFFFVLLALVGRYCGLSR